MLFTKKLIQAELSGLAALLLFSVAMGVYGLLENYFSSLAGAGVMFTPTIAAWLVFSYTGTFGIFAVIFYGAPVYAILMHKHLASWRNIILVGIAPGVVILLIDLNLSLWFILGGLSVASITHILFCRYVSVEAAP